MDRRDDDNLTTADLADTTRREPGAEAGAPPPDGQQVRTDADEGERRDDPAEAEAAGERPTAAVDEPPEAGATGERTTPEPATEPDGQTPLLPDDQAAEFRGRWESLQTGFVDEPRRAVEDGDALVAELMQRLAQSFSDERQTLEAQWDRGDDVSTEDLRVALQRYRSFFVRLLSA